MGDQETRSSKAEWLISQSLSPSLCCGKACLEQPYREAPRGKALRPPANSHVNELRSRSSRPSQVLGDHSPGRQLDYSFP